MKIQKLVNEMLNVSEKAACLARTVRAEEALFKLLVQEKTGAAKNKRFVQDFKTLTDVLVQQTVEHDLGQQFPSLRGHIRGEESNQFTNMLGDTISVDIQIAPEDTASLLAQVLDGNQKAADILASVVHQDITSTSNVNSELEEDVEIPDGTIGIWIDPIDSTAQYIHGNESEQDESGVHTQGLQSVLVLIGVYDLQTGLPVLGVVNQPFSVYDKETSSWQGQVWWGGCYAGQTFHCHPEWEESSSSDPPVHPRILMSSAESPEIRNSLSNSYTLITAHGGGYKVLCVFLGLVSGFVLSHNSCFKWDTCAPHSLLLAIGGGILDVRKSLMTIRANVGLAQDEVKQKLSQLVYDKPDKSNVSDSQQWSNTGGVLAYSDIDVAFNILLNIGQELKLL